MTAVRIAHADPGQNANQSASRCSPTTPGTGRCWCRPPDGALWRLFARPEDRDGSTPKTMPGR